MRRIVLAWLLVYLMAFSAYRFFYGLEEKIVKDYKDRKMMKDEINYIALEGSMVSFASLNN